jgi:hypothetical protein
MIKSPVAKGWVSALRRKQQHSSTKVVERFLWITLCVSGLSDVREKSLSDRLGILVAGWVVKL